MSVQLLSMTSLNPDAEDALEEYLSVVAPLMEAAGAIVKSRYELSNSIVGAGDIQFVTLIEYPDTASVHRVFGSDEYKSLENVKKLAFANYQVSEIAAT